jgi:hypothetical protein
MVHLSAGGRSSWVFVAAVTVGAASLGCNSGDKIVTYTVPKDSAPSAAAAVPVGSGEPVHRMLSAIVPEGGQAWIYKVVGPIPAVDAQADAILDFIAKVPPANGARIPAWQLPPGWASQPGSDGFTLATIRVPSDGESLDLTVSTVSWGAPAEMLLNNVNRWRGQMGLKAHESVEQVAQDTRELKAGERSIAVVDLKGTFRRGGMGGPFTGGMTGRGAPSATTSGARGTSGGGAMPADHPPIEPKKSETPAKEHKVDAKSPSTGASDLTAASLAPVPKFDAPASWTTLPAGGMNRAVFRMTDGKQEAVVTVSSIPAATAASFADPLSNANMWRGGVGLPDITKEQLPDATETIEVGGQPATLVRAIPGDDKPEGTVGAVVKNGDQIWFFKVKGARQLVVDQQDQFLSFLKSVQFAH